MDYQTYLTAQVKHVFSNLEEVEARLDADKESFLAPTFREEQVASIESYVAPRSPGRSAEATRPEAEIYGPDVTDLDLMDLGIPVEEERMTLLEAARSGLTKIRQAGDSRPNLTEEEMNGVEAIVLLEGRPSILIENGSFSYPPGEWYVLEDYRESIERAIAGVGRIEVSGHPRVDWLGTGFLVAPTVIMTNRHVAEAFTARRRGEGWQFKSGMKANIDFREEYGGSDAIEYDCVEVIGVHPQLDMALFRIEPRSGPEKALPEPLTVHYRTPKGMRDRKVYVLGYPNWDGRRNAPEAMRAIFAGIYGVKRLQPGTIRTHLVLGNTFKHDASTLGGNSGSCIVDLESGKVLGLHFAGKYRQYNTAVALWKLRRSTFLERAGVQFG